VDIIDAQNGQLRLRIFLPEPLAMLSSDIDGLHGGFLAVDENGQRIFALTASGLTIVQLEDVPLGIGSIAPGSGPAAGGTIVTIRGSGFQSGIKATIGGKAAAATFKDMNTLNLVVPPTSAGAQQMVLTNPDGESVSWDAAFVAN
jgi:IPT/TIG domain